MFSIANGYYYNHTVAVVGYKEYKNMRTGKVYTFLVVHDGWSTTTRYIAMKKYWCELCRVSNIDKGSVKKEVEEKKI